MNTILIPLFAYLILSLSIAIYARKQAKNKIHSEQSFLEEYFLGSRSLGGFVLAMAITSSYASASSFIGGPGVAYTLGLGWVLLAMIQVPTTFLTLGVLGSRFAKVSRELSCVTLTDFLYKRYQSSFLILIASLALVLFFVTAMVAQFIGGARLFQSVTGYSYETGLILFALTVVIYTSIGGFRAVALTDSLQGIVMLIASFALLFAVLQATNGVDNAIMELKKIDPALITPYGPNNSIPIPMMLSFWVLVGIGILGLPQTVQKCMAYKDMKSLKQAMLIGTIIIGFLLLALHLAGAFGRILYPDLASGDLIIPTLTLELFSPFWAGVFIAGPMAAIMSTVDTMLLLASAAIMKDLYIHFILKNDIKKMQDKKIRFSSFIITFLLGFCVFLAALNPPDLLVWINLFAFGGLEAVFLFPFILGLYWKKAEAKGAVSSIFVGLAVYIISTLYPYLPYKINAIVPALISAGLCFILVSSFVNKDIK